MSRKNTKEVILERVRNETVTNAKGCWKWTGSGSGRSGEYASINFEGKAQRLHRLMYMWHIGPISNDADVHHTCEVKRCVNPEHLVATNDHPSHHVATHCTKGHEFTLENTTHFGPNNNWRYCKTCHAARQKRYQQSDKGKATLKRRKEVEVS